MKSRRRTVTAVLVGCSVFYGNAQVPVPADSSVGAPGQPAAVDAAAAVNTTSNLPPPSPLPANTLATLGNLPSGTDATAGLPTLPAVSAPAPPAAPGVGSLVPLPAVGAPAGTEFQVPSVTLPSAPLPAASGAVGATAIAPTDSAPLMNNIPATAPTPVYPQPTIAAIERPLVPGATPTSPLIPGPSLAESTNQSGFGVTLPAPGMGTSNFTGAPVAGPQPTAALMTPPTVFTPQPGQSFPQTDLGVQAVMPMPAARPLRLDEPNSAFATPNPPNTLSYYASPRLSRVQDLPAVAPAPSMLEVIVLKGGQEFAATVLQKGEIWQVQLPNGSMLQIPGNKVSHARKELAVPTSSPNPRQKNFPLRQAFREEGHVARPVGAL